MSTSELVWTMVWTNHGSPSSPPKEGEYRLRERVFRGNSQKKAYRLQQFVRRGWVAAQKGPDIRGQFMRIKEAKKFTEATYQLEVTE